MSRYIGIGVDCSERQVAVTAPGDTLHDAALNLINKAERLEVVSSDYADLAREHLNCAAVSAAMSELEEGAEDRTGGDSVFLFEVCDNEAEG